MATEMAIEEIIIVLHKMRGNDIFKIVIAGGTFTKPKVSYVLSFKSEDEMLDFFGVDIKMADRGQTKISMHNFIRIARERGFSDDVIMIAGVLAGSEEGHKVFNDTKTAIDKFSDICKTSKNDYSFVKEIFQLVELNI